MAKDDQNVAEKLFRAVYDLDKGVLLLSNKIKIVGIVCVHVNVCVSYILNLHT